MHTSSPGVVTKTTSETSERSHRSGASPSAWFFSSILGDFRFQSTLILQPLGSSCSSSPTLSLDGETEKDLGGEDDLAVGAGIDADYPRRSPTRRSKPT